MNQDKQYFSKEVPFEIREDILRRNASANMSDVERAIFFGLPDGCRIRENAKIIAKENLNIGENCWVGEGAILDASGGLTIGAHTSIGLNVFVWTHDSHSLNIRSKNTREASKLIKRKPTKVGERCFIAGPSVILAGVTIGDKCIIPPMSVVSEDLPDGTIFNNPHSPKFLNELIQRIEYLEEKVSKLKSDKGK